MKKIITIIAAILMIASVLTGCGTSDTTTSTKNVSVKKPAEGTFKTEDATKAAVSKNVTDNAVDTTTEEPAVTAEPTVEEANADTADTNANIAANAQPEAAPAAKSDNKSADNSNAKQPANNNNAKAANAETPKQPSTQAQNNTPAQPAKPAEPVKTPTPHVCNYTATITANATCNTNGVKTYTCSCGNSYTESIPATGAHNWVNHTVTKSVKNTKIADLYTRDWSPSDFKYNAGCDVDVTKLRHCACGIYIYGADAASLHGAMMLDDTTSRHNQRSCDPSIDNPSGYYYIECGSTTETVVDYVYCSVCGTHQ